MIIKLLFISFFLSFSSSLFANSAPQITNLTTTVDLIENHRFVKRFRATDADGDSLTWSVDETFADSSNFTIDSDGKLFLNYTPDYEDSSQSRSLRVKIKVSDGAKTTSGKTSIKIKDAKSRQLVFNASPTT